VLHRRLDQSRFEVETRGATLEIAMTDFLSRHSGDPNDETTERNFRMDRAEYKLTQNGDTSTDPTDALDELDDYDRLGAIAEDQNRTDESSDDQLNEMIARRMEFLSEAVATLTDKQAVALWIWSIQWTETAAAEYLGISQPAYRETMYGKNGVGGVLRKISKYLAKHPIP
jgi:DNA-directed RNA polymerase specialized sigma subunit